MNYARNPIRWTRNDIVIHDSDAKESYMLMRVIGWTRTGLVKTQYVFPDKKRGITKKIYINEFDCLHDPKRFNIEVPKDSLGAPMPPKPQKAQAEFNPNTLAFTNKVIAARAELAKWETHWREDAKRTQKRLNQYAIIQDCTQRVKNAERALVEHMIAMYQEGTQ